MYSRSSAPTSVTARAVRRYSNCVSRIVASPPRPSTSARLSIHARPTPNTASSSIGQRSRVATSTAYRPASERQDDGCGSVPGPTRGIHRACSGGKRPDVHVRPEQQREEHRGDDQQDGDTHADPRRSGCRARARLRCGEHVGRHSPRLGSRRPLRPAKTLSTGNVYRPRFVTSHAHSTRTAALESARRGGGGVHLAARLQRILHQIRHRWPRLPATPRHAVVIGRLLAVAFLTCFATGLYSHFLQDPLPWMVFPTGPSGCIR